MTLSFARLALFALVVGLLALVPARALATLAIEYGGMDRTIVIRIWNSSEPIAAYSLDPARLHVALTRTWPDASAPILLEPLEHGVLHSQAPAKPSVHVTTSMELDPTRDRVIDVHLPVPRDLPPGIYTIRFNESAVTDSTGRPIGQLQQPEASRLYVPAADPQDRALAIAREDFVGKRFYAPVGLSISCDPDTLNHNQVRLYGTDVFTVTSVERSDAQAYEIVIGGTAEPRFLSGNTVIALQPLLVHLRLPQRRGCPTPTMAFVDDWEVSRFLTPQNPKTLPGLTARFRAALETNTILPGMTRAMVASVLGYPSLPGTVEQLNRLKTWHYETAFVADEQTVYFSDSSPDALVVRYDPPAESP